MGKIWLKASTLAIAVLLFSGTGCAEMIGMSNKGAPVEVVLEGRWISFDDEYATMEFVEGVKIDYYEGVKISQGPYQLEEDTLTVTIDEDMIRYTVVELTADALQLTYLGPGNTLRYLRLVE